jgi:gluconolactonase
MKYLIASMLAVALFACGKKEKLTGTIERIDPAFDALVDSDAKVEVIAEGFDWSEGPLWLPSANMLIFSDVPKNTIYKWTPEKGKEIYLIPSGYMGNIPRGGEMGSNGLALTNEGKLAMAQHGDRRVALMNAPLDAPAPNFVSLGDNYEGKKFNSPNDLVFNDKGDVFFTDPPYGLPNQEKDSTRETPFQGVYKASQGKVTLITDSITRPNGIAFLPGYKTLIVANSDPAKAIWYAYDIFENDSVANARIFYDATAEAKKEKGVPDGFKIDSQGNVFASGPGGLWIMNKDGKVLGKIKLSEATSNCALSPDEKTLYVTCDMYVARIKLRK